MEKEYGRNRTREKGRMGKMRDGKKGIKGQGEGRKKRIRRE